MKNIIKLCKIQLLIVLASVFYGKYINKKQRIVERSLTTSKDFFNVEEKTKH